MKHKRVVDIVYKFTLNVLSNLLSTFFFPLKNYLVKIPKREFLCAKFCNNVCLIFTCGLCEFCNRHMQIIAWY